MISQHVQRRAFLGRVGRPVVDASNARLMSRNVIKNRLNDVRQNAKVGQSSCDGSANVVQSPRRARLPKRLRNAVVQRRLRLAPAQKGPSPEPNTRARPSRRSIALKTDSGTLRAARHALRRSWCARPRCATRAAMSISSHASPHFLPPLARQDEQAHDRPKVPPASLFPDRRQLHGVSTRSRATSSSPCGSRGRGSRRPALRR